MVRADSWLGRLVRALAAEPPEGRDSRYGIIRALAAQPHPSFPDRHDFGNHPGAADRPRPRPPAFAWLWAVRLVLLLTVVTVAAVVAGAPTSGGSVLATVIAILATVTLVVGARAFSARLGFGLLRQFVYRRLRIQRVGRFAVTLLVAAVVAVTLAVLLNALLQ